MSTKHSNDKYLSCKYMKLVQEKTNTSTIWSYKSNDDSEEASKGSHLFIGFLPVDWVFRDVMHKFKLTGH